MYKIFIHIDENGKGSFVLSLGGKTMGRINVNISGNELILLRTIVPVKRYLHTVGNRLLQEIVDYARMHELKIITVSAFVKRQFSSDPASYADVWEKG